MRVEHAAPPPSGHAREVDEELSALSRSDLPSQVQAGISYRLGERLGDGGMAVAFYAMRIAEHAKTPTVVKITRPSVVAASSETALLIVRKEAVALGRLNERVPPTPYVVRLLDTGVTPVHFEGVRLDLPWLALEYVRGGPEGTTLRARVESSIRTTGFAFDAGRAASAIRAISLGLTAVHEVGVIHRDMKPDNVLCCGFGEEEICKVADFGIARPAGMVATFGAHAMGTPGYAPPELAALDAAAIGPWSDVFSLACIAFFVLTGEDYFPFDTPARALRAMRMPERRGIADAAGLAPELRSRATACLAIDRVLARATSPDPHGRPATAEAFAVELLPCLHAAARPVSPRPRTPLFDDAEQTRVDAFRWTIRSEPLAELIVRSVAWEADGHCLAATNQGLLAWTGSEWAEILVESIPRAGVRFVERLSPDRWLVGGDDGAIATLQHDGIAGSARIADGSRIERFSGDLDDIGVALTNRSGDLALHAIVSRRRLRPMPLSDVGHVTGLARIAEEAWLVCGRSREGRGFIGKYLPLEWQFDWLAGVDARTMLSCAARVELSTGVACGIGGSVMIVSDTTATAADLDHEIDLSAAALDPGGQPWVASASHIFGWAGRDHREWRCFWSDTRVRAPIVSLRCDEGIIRAVTADGALIEGVGSLTRMGA